MRQVLRIVLLLLLTVPVAGCDLIGGIFKGGLILGIIIAVIVIALLMKVFGRRRPD